MFTHDHAVADDAECIFHTCFEACCRFMQEPDPFFPASVTSGQTDVGSGLTNDLLFPYQPPATSNSAYNTSNTLSQSGRMVAESPSATGIMFSDGSDLLSLRGAFAYVPWTEDHSPGGMDIDRQGVPPWPSELMGLASQEGVALQPSLGATTRCHVFANCIDGLKLGLDSMDRARCPDIFDNRLELPAILEEYHWGYFPEPQSTSNICEQSTQDRIWQDDLGKSGKIESIVNQDQLSAHLAGPFEQGVVGPKKCDTVSESTASNARAIKPFICRETGCKSEGFTHFFNLQRHKRTVHMEQGAGYRCTVQGCPKADKLWTRHDGYRKHVKRRHSDANLNDLVKRFNRSRPNADVRFLFSITTPTMLSQKEQAAKSTKSQSARVEDSERLSQI